jgi:Domain of unknown function (DUF4288)
MWFAAHVIMSFKFKDGNQDRYPVWENVFLVEAASTDVAFEKAARLGRAEEGDCDGSLTCNGRSATLTYAGIRKLVSVDAGMADLKDRPVDGAEVTYSVLEVKGARAFARLVKGEPVTIRYEE